jgi:hypothetical protein
VATAISSASWSRHGREHAGRKFGIIRPTPAQYLTEQWQGSRGDHSAGPVAGRRPGADVYLVFVGWRHGYVRGTNGEPDGRSITELEVRGCGAAGKPVLAFLLDPDTPSLPTSFDALTEAGGDEIVRFRSRLGSAYLAGIFRTLDNLASQTAAKEPDLKAGVRWQLLVE